MLYQICQHMMMENATIVVRQTFVRLLKSRIHDIPGTLGNENRCPQCARGQGNENSGIESSKWPNTQLFFRVRNYFTCIAVCKIIKRATRRFLCKKWCGEYGKIRHQFRIW